MKMVYYRSSPPESGQPRMEMASPGNIFNQTLSDKTRQAGVQDICMCPGSAWKCNNAQKFGEYFARLEILFTFAPR